MAFISVIICSRNKYLSKDLCFNIQETIGCEYELIIIDNSDNNYSIFEAYNIGLDKSNAKILCFIHEDVLFCTKNWGIKIDDIFNKIAEAGIIGLAGVKVKSDIPSGWWEQNKKYHVKNIMQHRPDGTKEMLSSGFGTNSEVEVAVIDGVFMCLRKDSQIRFNENLKGFHNYDQSICLDYLKNNYKVLVTDQILLEHFSNGRIDSGWVNSTYKFHKLYKKHLPKSIGNIAIGDYEKLRQFSQFIFHCKNTGNAKLAFRFWLKLLKNEPFHSKHYDHVQYFLNFIKRKLT